MRYSLAKGNAPTGQRVCRFRQKSCHALRDWGSEKVVNISYFVFRFQSSSQNIKPNYPLKTKRDKENTFSLLPPQAVPLFLAKTANPLSLRDISLSKGILIRGRLAVSQGFIKWKGIPRYAWNDSVGGV